MASHPLEAEVVQQRAENWMLNCGWCWDVNQLLDHFDHHLRRHWRGYRRNCYGWSRVELVCQCAALRRRQKGG